MTKRLVFPKEQTVKLESFTLPELKPDEVQVRNQYTLMSIGTENIVLKRLFEAGTHWDDWVKYPFYPGYAAVGKIAAVGSEVKNVFPGDIVVHRGAHASDQIQNVNSVYRVPDNCPPQKAVWFALAKISFMGAKAAGHFLGDNVLIVGAGPIGQMSVRWANAAGAAKIIAIDLFANRLKLAVSGGADIVYDQYLSEKLKADVMEQLNGKLPDIVIDTTGNSKVFSECLNFVTDFGKVVLLGDTGTPSQQHLSRDVITRGLSICGAHDIHSGGCWPDEKIFNLFFTLQGSNRYNMTGLNTHEFKPEDCVKAYQLANENRGDSMGIIFDWTNN